MNLRAGSKYLGIAISLVTLLVFTLIYGAKNLIDTFSSLPLEFVIFFLAALSFHLLSFVFWAIRLMLLSRASGYRVSFVKSFITVISSLFAASITPGYIGGEPVRIKKLVDYGLPIGSATATTLAERGFDSVFFVGVFAFVILTGVEILSGTLRIYATIGIIVLIVFIAFLLLSIGAYSLMKRLIGWIERVVQRFGRKGKNYENTLAKIFEEVKTYSSSTRQIFLRSPAILSAGLVATAMMWLSDFTVPIILLMGFGAMSNILYIIFIQVILVLISLIPVTPGSAGIMEVLMVATFSIFLPHSYLIAFVIMWRFITFYFNIILGSLAMHNIVAK